MSELKELNVIEPTDVSIKFFKMLCLASVSGLDLTMPLPVLECLVLQGPKPSEHIPTFALSGPFKEALLAFLMERQFLRRPLSECKIENCGELGDFVYQVEGLCNPVSVASRWP